MSKVMLVNVRHAEESRVAILQDGVLAAYEIETLNRAHIKGNIYNAVVETVHPSLEAAFLKISPELKGFLPLDEVNFRLLPTRGEKGKSGRIGQHLRQGQKLMVQVVREPFGGKAPTVSTYFSIPGRYLVLMPGVDSAGVSRKIVDAVQRDRLKEIVDELRLPEGFGLIVRTAGLGQNKVEMQRDLRYLLRLWESVQRASRATDFPGLVYRERDLVIRTIRDYFTPDINEVWIDSKDTHERALEFVQDVMPTKAKTMRLFTGQRPLFNKFNLEEQIESIYKRRVQLPSGGEIVVDGTEALTAIDVNSARTARKGDPEESITQTNIEAAAEIARQLRLRDLGGLVVIDFIDMLSKRNQKNVEKAMRDALRGDKAKYDVTPISRLGLMEVARQRIKGEKMGATYAACPTCEGYGLVKNVDAAALTALRKLQTRSARGDAGRITMDLPPDVAVWILNNKRDDLLQIERQHDLQIELVPKPALLRHESDLRTFPREQPPAEPAPPPAPEPVEEPREAAEPAAASSEPAPGAPRKRRRRRRRHTRAGVLATADEPAPASGPSVDTLPETAEGGEPAAGPGSEPPGTAVAEGSPPAITAGEPASPATVAEAETGGEAPASDGGARKRRRRRRRRRPAQSVAGESDAEPASSKEEDHAAPPSVPAGVRSDELMPAAVHGNQEGKPKRRSRSRRKHGERKSAGGRAHARDRGEPTAASSSGSRRS